MKCIECMYHENEHCNLKDNNEMNDNCEDWSGKDREQFKVCANHNCKVIIAIADVYMIEIKSTGKIINVCKKCFDKDIKK